jgi:Fic family protein
MTRHYLKTHPWITFKASQEINSAGGGLWFQLGRITALCENLSHTALRPELASSLHMAYLVKGVHATTAIEGNTLTESQVKEVIEGAVLRPSKEYLAQEARNVIAGFNEITGEVAQDHQPSLSAEQLCHINELVQRGLDVGDHVTPGEYRTASVGVGTYLAPPAEDCHYLVKEMFTWLTGPEFQHDKDRMAIGILKAVIAHLYVAWIHPFGDGNGRTARMLEFQILVSSGVPSPAAHLLSNHYNLTREQYYRELERSSSTPDGNIMPFIHYALQGFIDGLEEQLESVRDDLETLVWRGEVDRAYGYECSKTDQRRKRLACHLFEAQAPRMASTLIKDPSVGAWYVDRTTKTLVRDLNDIASHGLIEKVQTGWRARSEIVFGMRPESN